MIPRSLSIFTAGLVLAITLQACTPVSLVLGAGAATGLAAYQERGIDGVARDLRTATLIFDLFARADHRLLKDVSIDVYEGRVLLTGEVKTEDRRATAVRLAWTAGGVTEVLNEIHVTDTEGVLDTARDAWISTQLEAALTFDKRIFAINYAIETSAATVYLIGIAQSQDELERVKNHARTIPYVRHIISYVRVKDPVKQAVPGP